jgi:ABC-type branched-subunit amino acid transport system substrate-binding protein
MVRHPLSGRALAALGLAGTLLAGAAGLSACSSSGSSSGTPGSTSGTSGTSSGTSGPGTSSGSSSSGPIVIGGIDAAFNFPGTADGFQARIARFNAAGGIDGRKIQFVGVTDDQDSPSSELTDLQKLVQSDHVFAVAPMVDDVLSGAATTFLAQNNVPAVGYGVTQSWCNSQWMISVIGCNESPDGWETTALVKEVIQAAGIPASQIRVAIEGYDNAAAVQVSKTLGEVWQSLGTKIVLNEEQVPVTGAQSQAPFVQAIMASKPNIVFELLGSSPSIALAAALKQGGYSGIIYNGAAYEPAALKSQPSVAAALQGVLVTAPLPTEYDGTPAVTQELSDLKSIADAPDIELGTDVGYWSADLLIQLLEATKARGAALTPQNLVQTVQAGVTVKPAMAGGNGPLTWPLYADRPQACAALVRGAGTTYDLVEKFTCYNDIKVAASP